MARDYDGTNDNVSFGSDASIDAFSLQTIALWVRRHSTAQLHLLVAKDRAGAAWAFFINPAGSSNFLLFQHAWSGVDAQYRPTTAIDDTARNYHVVVTYDGTGAAPGNFAVMYVDGVSETVTRVTTATGSIDSDAAASLFTGESGAGASDADVALQNLSYDNTIWTADMVNRHKWYGRPGGAVKFCQQFFTTKLNNEGTATANGTVSGSGGMASLPRVERCWGAMMGVGR